MPKNGAILCAVPGILELPETYETVERRRPGPETANYRASARLGTGRGQHGTEVGTGSGLRKSEVGSPNYISNILLYDQPWMGQRTRLRAVGDKGRIRGKAPAAR